MKQRVLVTYASKYGATKEIAEKISQTLAESGLTVDLRPAQESGDVSIYDAIILGSAVYAGSWRRDAVEFLQRNEHLLAERPTWFFSSGPTGEGEDPQEMMKGWNFPEAQQDIADRIRPRGIAIFHGALEMDKLNFAEKLIIRGMRVATGDYRDWKAIKAWTDDIVTTLQTERSTL